MHLDARPGFTEERVQISPVISEVAVAELSLEERIVDARLARAPANAKTSTGTPPEAAAKAVSAALARVSAIAA